MRRATGHIMCIGKDHYKVKISLGKDAATGKYLARWYFIRGSRTEAENKLSELRHQYNIGALTKPGKTTVKQFLTKWLTDYAKPNLTAKSYERYESICRVHLIPALGNIQLTQLTPARLQALYASKLESGLAPRTVRYHHVILHKALATAHKWGMVTQNVADGVDVPRAQNREMLTWDEIELNTFLEAAKGGQYYALFYTALFTGMRRSELLALRWQDIDFVYGQISVSRGLHQINKRFIFTQPKTKKSRRSISLSPSTFLMLQSYRKAREIEAKMLDETVKDSDLVFSSLGKPLRPNTITRAWHNLAVKAGVKIIRFHDARHTHASLMLKQGIHPKIVQERLGHSTISITLDTYSHVAPGMQDAAAKRFDDIVQIKDNEKAHV
jgi:integrase